jgi:carbon monoxide dehydrogenase subunit G
MKLSNNFIIDAPQQVVWDFITNPEHIGPCIPGCEDVETVGPDKYRAAIKIHVGAIKTIFHVTITTLEERPPEYSKYVTEGDEGGRASRIKATSSLTISKLDEQRCEVSYSSDISIAGRLGKFSAGVMNMIANKLSEKFVATLRDRIQSNEF